MTDWTAMPMALKPAKFTHTPLADAGKQIRLLRFRNSHDFDDLTCESSTWSLHDDAPPYVAASYMWGSSEKTSWITIDGRPYEIRRNCYDALRRIRRQIPEGYVWVDSICINQTDLQEKSLQVEMMGDIYVKADVVYSCVGDHADGSQGVLSAAKDVACFMRSDGRCPQQDIFQWEPTGDRSKSLLRDAWWKLQSFKQDPRRLLEGTQRGTWIDSELEDSFTAFSYRPYWHRMWIIQEVYLARKCTVLCDANSISFHDLALVMSVFRYSSKNIVRERPAKDLSASHLYRLTAPITGRDQRMGSAKKSRRQLLTYGEAIERFLQWECSDPRDRLYALSGIVSWPFVGNRKPWKADYLMSPVRVASGALQNLTIMPARPQFTFNSRLRIEPRDLRPGAACRVLIEALELSFKDQEVQELLDGQSLGSTESYVLSIPYTDNEPGFVGILKLDSSFSEHDTAGSADHTQVGVAFWADKETSVYVCPRALPGDIVYTVPSVLQDILIILRQRTKRASQWEYVGPAFVQMTWNHVTSPGNLFSPSPAAVHQYVIEQRQEYLRMFFQVEDILILTLYDRAYRDGVLSAEDRTRFLSYPRAVSNPGTYAYKESRYLLEP